MNKTLLIGLCLWSLVSTGAAAPLQLTDMTGRTVVLSAPAKRLVTTYMPATIFTLSLGLQDQLVGISNQDQRQSLVKGLLAGRSPVQVGSRSAGINLETIIGLKPDLVLINDKKDGARLAEQLQQLGIAALLIKAESLEQVQQAMDLIAKATGHQAQALRYQQLSGQLIDELTRKLASTTPVRGYYGNGGDLYRSVNAQMYQHQLLELAGITNVAADVPGFYPKINLEQLLRWQPEMLVLEQGKNGRLAQQLNATELAYLSKLPRVTLPSGALWHMPSPVAVAGAYYLASQVHPQQFNDTDVSAVVADFYQQLLGQACLSPLPDTKDPATGAPCKHD
ncbi:ABC transporter substrate-binding protein [Ferrimonas aestuarii]|uniref:ABC transporter substrate-binding protein n=1 Tax=Ferrimonas aestuarii TaxID=2569539 RepID=A0A4U1BTL0_9GAMM|nr:ABC transporter substrate-binding protein [Ferrimonas aestuarii]TKB58690.1 ABC transporter substrate-binding protein [Ferrimonas aestuarii]